MRLLLLKTKLLSNVTWEFLTRVDSIAISTSCVLLVLLNWSQFQRWDIYSVADELLLASRSNRTRDRSSKAPAGSSDSSELMFWIAKYPNVIGVRSSEWHSSNTRTRARNQYEQSSSTTDILAHIVQNTQARYILKSHAKFTNKRKISHFYCPYFAMNSFVNWIGCFEAYICDDCRFIVFIPIILGDEILFVCSLFWTLIRQDYAVQTTANSDLLISVTEILGFWRKRKQISN
jgi:hypothetical protein